MSYEKMIAYKVIDRDDALAYQASLGANEAIAFASWLNKIEAGEAKELETITEGIFLALVESGVDKLLCPTITDEALYETAVELSKLIAVRLYVDRNSAA